MLADDAGDPLQPCKLSSWICRMLKGRQLMLELKGRCVRSGDVVAGFPPKALQVSRPATLERINCTGYVLVECFQLLLQMCQLLLLLQGLQLLQEGAH